MQRDNFDKQFTDVRYKLVNCDTDSIMISHEDDSLMSEEERDSIVEKVNSLFTDNIRWEDDGYFERVICIKIKNYVLYDGKNIKCKGSAIKDPKKEPALKEFINRLIDCLLFDKTNYKEIYAEYVNEIMNLKDIMRWSVRKTLTENVLNAKRTNEQKILDSIEGTEYKEGDRFHVFYKEDGRMCLSSKFDGNYDKKRMLKKLYLTGKIFETLLPTETIFPNYSLIRNYKHL